MHIILAGFYSLQDGFLAFTKMFRNLGHYVSFFPLLWYLHHSKENYKEDLIDMINKKEKKYKGDIIFDKTDEKIIVVLWWCHYKNLHKKDLKEITLKTKDIVKHISFNWDPTYINSDKNSHWINERKHSDKNCKFMDTIISVNPYEIENLNHKNKIYCCPGGNPNISYPIYDKNYICDVSIVCTNLYDSDMFDRDLQNINRKDLVDMIYKDKDIKFNFYGPDSFKDIYPESYKGFIKYDNCNKVFYNSKINICVQAVNIEGYLSERLPQILMSKGLIFIDTKIKNNLIENEDYILIDLNDPIGQIKKLLKDEEYCNKIRENGYKKSMLLSWDNLCNIIIKESKK